MIYPFVGPSYVLSALRASCQSSVNLFVELVEIGTGKVKMYLKRTPGLSLFSTITGSNGPVRAVFAGENRLFAVVGSHLYEIFQDATFTNRGALGSATTGPAQFAANGNQLLITSGGQAYCDSGSGPVLVEFNDGAGNANTFALSGTVNTSDAGGVFTATSVSGNDFTQLPLGGQLNINGVYYTMTAIDTTGFIATLGSDPGTQSGVGWTASLATWSAEDFFINVSPGDLVVLNNLGYEALSVDPTATTMTLHFAAIPTNSNIAWSAFALNGRVSASNLGGGVSVIRLLSGDPFDPTMIGQTITILPNTSGSTLHTYTVTAVTPGQVTISGSLSGSNMFYGANLPLSAGGCTFLDTYFITFQAGSKIINISANNDGTTWSPLDFATKEGYPDNIAAILADHEQLWIQGDEVSTEIWQDTGNANFPLQRAPGGFIQYANLAPQTLCRFNTGIAWLGGDEVRGAPQMFFAQSYEPVRISNHAVEAEWTSYATYYDAIMFPYIENGHYFLVVSFPTANKTWAYDATASQQTGVAQWHQRGFAAITPPLTAPPAFSRQLQSTHAFVQGGLTSTASGGSPGAKTGPSAHYVGDATAVPGLIYLQSEAYLSDAGQYITRLRTMPVISNEDDYTYFGPFELFANVNNNAAAPINPVMDYSHNWGVTYVNPQGRTSYNAALPDTNLTRMIWKRQGKSRGRVYRVYAWDIADFAFIDAYGDEIAGASVT